MQCGAYGKPYRGSNFYAADPPIRRYNVSNNCNRGRGVIPHFGDRRIAYQAEQCGRQIRSSPVNERLYRHHPITGDIPFEWTPSGPEPSAMTYPCVVGISIQLRSRRGFLATAGTQLVLYTLTKRLFHQFFVDFAEVLNGNGLVAHLHQRHNCIDNLFLVETFSDS